jgi:signal transduction histidine kinase
VSRIRLLRSTSFRLATIYLALFVASALALGAFIYVSVRREILADFDDRIVEETNALRGAFAGGGRERLAQAIAARGPNSSFTYEIVSPDGRRLIGDISAPRFPPSGWFEARESEAYEARELEQDEPPGAEPEFIRALVTPLPDGSSLVVGDERRRLDDILRGVLSAFGWAVAATLLLGTLGGLWLSGQFLRRIDSMRLTAQRLMAGDWSRRIPLSALDDDLTSLARSFNRLFDRIERLLIANKHVSADIAHDLRKPLASMLRRLEAARAGDASLDAVRADIEGAIEDIGGVLETFDALLRIGQIEAGARRAAFRPLDLAEVAREVVEAYEPAAEEERKTLNARLDGPLPISGDRELLVQMIANLLDNALRHTPPGVRVEVSGRRSARGVELSVADDGRGVPPAELTAILQPLYRAEASRTSPGTGLGLSLVAAIAELHGFECSASDNRPGLRITLSSLEPAD